MKILEGVRVLDLTNVLSGPFATLHLALLGAEVIKIEPPAGDLTRFATPRRHGLSSYFVQQNVGKANLSIDLATPDGAEILLRHNDGSAGGFVWYEPAGWIGAVIMSAMVGVEASHLSEGSRSMAKG